MKLSKYLKMILIGVLAISFVACSDSKISDDKNNNNTQIEKVEDNKKKREYLVTKYFELEKGVSFNDVLSTIDSENITINDSEEFETPTGYKKREVNIIDGKNKLELVFRDNQLGSKTFTYDTDNTNSTWFYSNYYDILDAKDTSEESHGIWINAIKETTFNDEYEMNIYLQDNNF